MCYDLFAPCNVCIISGRQCKILIKVSFDLEYLRKLRLGRSQTRLESRFCKFRKYCRKLKGELFYFYCHLIDENYTNMGYRFRVLFKECKPLIIRFANFTPELGAS